jgi:NTP pyrophosphatase (non-canonical NTP hydrolase)
MSELSVEELAELVERIKRGVEDYRLRLERFELALDELSRKSKALGEEIAKLLNQIIRYG